MSEIVLLLQIAATMGFGLLGLRLLGVSDAFRPAERPVFAFALGFGILGWILFVMGVAGLLSPPWLLGILILGSGGLLLLESGDAPVVRGPWNATSVTLVALLG